LQTPILAITFIQITKENEYLENLLGKWKCAGGGGVSGIHFLTVFCNLTGLRTPGHNVKDVISNIGKKASSPNETLSGGPLSSNFLETSYES
jgi:hypothetical protein